MSISRTCLSAFGASTLVLAGCAGSMSDDGMMSDTAPSGTATARSTTTTTASTPASVMVGGQPMYANRTIADNAVNAPNLSQVVSLLQRANLVDTLRGAGPFTVLAPNNDAFTRVPAETMGRLGGNNDLLSKALTYHVLPGRFTRADIVAAIRAGGGTASFNTVNGNPLRARMEGEIVVLEGNNNSIAYFQQADVSASNGIVHVINGVLIPPALG